MRTHQKAKQFSLLGLGGCLEPPFVKQKGHQTTRYLNVANAIKFAETLCVEEERKREGVIKTLS